MMPATQVRELSPGDVFVSHRIEGFAGRGGMGVVYRAIDLDLDRTVALKVIAPALADDPDFRARFVAESKAAASIEHPHVIPVYYAGEREGVLFIVMRYVDGPDLRALVRAEGRLDAERAARIVAQVGGALDAAHAHGLVHRDVKPANVLLGADDHAYLTDFGLTTSEASSDVAHRRAGWVGTLGFVAPEQIRGQCVDARTDVYALGCVLVHALTGAGPFVRDCDEATLWAHLHAPAPVDRVPEAFATVIGRALAKNPDDRYPSAGDLGRAALAAAGASAPRRPERSVACAASQDVAPRATLRVSVLADEGETIPSPHHDASRRSAGLAVRLKRVRAIAGAAALLAIGALAAGVLIPDPTPVADSTTSAPRSTATPPARQAAVGSVRLSERADALAIADGSVWALSSATGHINVFDAVSGEPRHRVDIGTSPTPGAIAAGFGSVWTVKSNTRSLIRIGARSERRHLDRSTTLATTGSTDRLATGEGAVWVASRNGADHDVGGESIVRIDPGTLRSQQVAVSGGIAHIAVGEGALWVTNRFRPTVTRIDADDISDHTTIPLGEVPDAISVGQRAVWMTSPRGPAVVRVNPRTYRRTRIAMRHRPSAIAIADGSVWVARAGGGLVAIDPHTLRLRRRALTTADSPSALASNRGRTLWLTLVRRGTLQRVTI